MQTRGASGAGMGCWKKGKKRLFEKKKGTDCLHGGEWVKQGGPSQVTIKRDVGGGWGSCWKESPKPVSIGAKGKD